MRTPCPMCKTVFEVGAEAPVFHPFCSQRCKLADLHNWLSDAYRISTPLGPGDLEDDEVEAS